MTNKLKYLVLGLTIIVAGCKVHNRQPSPVTSIFQADLDSQIHENMPGILATVISKEKKIDWSGASSTLARMLAPVQYPAKQPLDYRMGIWEIEIEGMRAYTHSGFWGTQVVYIPDIKAAIAVNYSQHWGKKGPAPVIPMFVKQLLK